LRYLQGGQAIRADIEYELFDWALGDNPRNKVYIRVPEIRGIPITANSLFKLTEHFKKFHFVRRRPHKTRGPHADPDDELTVFYDLTPTGSGCRSCWKGSNEQGPARNEGVGNSE